VDFLAAAAGLAPPLSGQAIAVVSAAPAAQALPPVTPQGLVPVLAAGGNRDSTWALAAALRDARDGAGGGWGDALGPAPWEQDLAAVFPPAAE
jgi:hypothetical protein